MLAAAILAVLAVLFVGMAWVGQRRLVYFPSQVVPSPPPEDVRTVELATGDDLSLAAWLVPARPGTTAPRGSTPPSTILVFHGNGGNRVGRLPLGRALAARGHDVLLVDYRGYGGNPGTPSSAGLARDADAALDWAHASGGPDRPIVLLGESLGAAVAVELATRRPPDALVLRSPFSSLTDVAREHYPVVPGAFLRDRWPNVERMRTIHVPTLVVAGDADEVVPAAQSRRVADAAAGPRALVVVEGAGHNDRALLDGPVLLDAIDDFLATHLPGADGRTDR